MSETASGFEQFSLTRQFLNALEDAGIQDPTPIQEKALPLGLQGQDVIGIAPTGTGKTIAYLLPIVSKLKYAQGEAPRALVLAPTKELVVQIHEHLGQLTPYTDLRSIALYGGIGPKKQLEDLAEGQDILIATPGRFLELYQKGGVPTKAIRVMVLDEADKLMDMGFMGQIRSILEVIPSKKRQNLLFSATFSDKVSTLSEEFLEFPSRVEVAPQATTAEQIDQYYFKTPNFKSKVVLLQHLLEDVEQFHRVIVFVNTKQTADNIMKFVDRKLEGGVRAVHSNKSQNARINAVKDFSTGEIRVLVATDVSARGIDVKEVSHVINFDLPTSRYEDYVHRIGRTGRAYAVGTALSFAHKAEQRHLTKITELTKSPVELLEVPQGVVFPETPKEEIIQIERQLDTLKRREDPNFQGAFHDKKDRNKKNDPPKKKRRR